MTQLPSLVEKFERAHLLQRQGLTDEARRLLQEILDQDPDYFDALNLLGVVSGQLGDLNASVRWFEHAIALCPNAAMAHCNRGLALKEMQRFDAALASFDTAISLNPDDFAAHYSRAAISAELGQSDSALGAYDRAIEIRPDFAPAHFGRGRILQESHDWLGALEAYNRAIKFNSRFVDGHRGRAIVHFEMKNFEAAIDASNNALALEPDHARTHLHRANALRELGRLDEALAGFDQAIRTDPELAEAFSNRGALLQKMRRFEAAMGNYDRAIEVKPGNAGALFNRAQLHRELGDTEAAARDLEAAAKLAPDLEFLPGLLLEARMQQCDWREFESQLAGIAKRIELGEPVAPPFSLMSIIDSPRLQLQAAQIWVRDVCPPDVSLESIPRRAANERIRIGYFSADFRTHPVAILLAEVLECHDRSKFEIIAFYFGPDVQDEMRSRLEKTFARFLDVRERSDREVAQLARSLDIDIAVDLNGHTGGSRPMIFAQRAAPVQINFLGYPGTTGAPYMDYLISDEVIIPTDYQSGYSEKVIYLPGSYLPNDSTRSISTATFRRDQLRLPAEGFVFCSFNNAYKINPLVFEAWMRILRAVPRSVLWLSPSSAIAMSNLRRTAAKYGIDSYRILFAERMPSLSDHLARLRSADLFLDTRPYNAHSTAIDALWAGLPLLTCMGDTFCSRVASSLLSALGIPELIAATPAQYEEIAIQIALQPKELELLKQKIAARLRDSALFDIQSFTRNLEAGYSLVHERLRRGLPPDHVRVTRAP